MFDLSTKFARSFHSEWKDNARRVFTAVCAMLLAFSLAGSSVAIAITEEPESSADGAELVESVSDDVSTDANAGSLDDASGFLSNDEFSDPSEELADMDNNEGADSEDLLADEEAPNEDVNSVAEDADESNITTQADGTITNKTINWTDGTYTLDSNVTITSRITVNGTVTLQLNEGCTLDAQAGITVNGPSKLIIQGSGTLNASSPNTTAGLRNAVIGSVGEPSSGLLNGTIEIRSGTVNVSRPAGATNVTGAGIGSGLNGLNGSVLISGGNVNVYTASTPDGYGAGIGQGSGANANGITVTITGGTVVAHGASSSHAIGGTERGSGFWVYAHSVAITGGNVTALSDGYRSGVGAIANGNFSLGDAGADMPNTVQLHMNSNLGLVDDTSKLNGLIFIDDEVTAYGNSGITSELHLSSGQRLTVPDDAVFTVMEGASLVDDGAVVNNGSIRNNGAIYGAGTFENNGTLDGSGTFFPQQVMFDTNGGSSVDSKLVNKGSAVGSVSDPVREGYTFDGWFTDSALTTPWNVASDAVNVPLTLYAKWTPVAAEEPEQPTTPDQPEQKPAEPSNGNQNANTEDPAEGPILEPMDSDEDSGEAAVDSPVEGDESPDTLPKLSDPIALLPFLLGAFGILIFLCFDNAKRARSTH